MTSRKPRQHLVPQVLIRRWTNDLGLVKYRRRSWATGTWKDRSPRSVMFARGYYTLPGEHNPDRAERALGVLENIVARILQPLFAWLDVTGPKYELETYGHWHPSEHTLLREFVLCQKTRVQTARDKMIASHSREAFVAGILSAVENDEALARYVNEVDPAALESIYQRILVGIQVSPARRPPLLKGFESSEVVIARIDLDAPQFALVDDPVLLAGPYRTSLDDEVGSSRGIPGQDPDRQLILPIDPRYALVLIMPDGPLGPRKIREISRGKVWTWLERARAQHAQVLAPWGDAQTAKFFDGTATDD